MEEEGGRACKGIVLRAVTGARGGAPIRGGEDASTRFASVSRAAWSLLDAFEAHAKQLRARRAWREENC